MAWTASLTLAALATTANGSSYSTASHTPTANRLLIAVIVGRSSGTFVNEPTVDGNGLTWTKIDSRLSGKYLGAYSAPTGASPTAGAVSATFDISCTGCAIQVFSVDGGTDLAQAAVQANGSSATPAATLGSAPSATNAVFGVGSNTGQDAGTPGTGFTELANDGFRNPTTQVFAEWGTGITSATVDATWAGSSGWDWIAFELAQASAGSSVSVTPGVRALTTTTFAPTATASDHKIVTPSVRALAVTAFAPSVVASDQRVVTPGAGSLTTATFAPTVNVSFGASIESISSVGGYDDSSITYDDTAVEYDGAMPVTVTPGVAALALSTFAPSVLLPVTVKPGVTVLTLTAFAPSVNLSVVIAPGAASLTLATFAATILVSQSATPGAASLALTMFAPSVVVSANTPGEVVVEVLASQNVVAVVGSLHSVVVAVEATHRVEVGIQ